MVQLKVSELSCEYDQQVIIEQLSFELQKNEIVALLGPSGCGKTTLLKAVAGLMPISQGQIELEEQVVNTADYTLPSEKRRLGMIFQDYALFPHLNVADNIAFGIAHWSQQKRQQRVAEMLELIRLDDLGERFPHELSGGQQQRVAIARALAYQPKLILLDEAFSNIDSNSRTQLMREIRHILKQQKVAAVLVTHSKEEAFMFADRIAIINQGKIAQLATSQELYAQPTSKFVADFIGKANYIEILAGQNNQVNTAIGWIESADTKLEIEGKSHVMLRPEQIGLKSGSEGGAEIVERSFLGAHWVYQVQQEPHLNLEVINHLEFQVGDKVELSVQPHKLVLF